ncbi:3'-5' exonuclease [Alkalilimnicola ehrlichii]|uniref:3'-5' exonuclease n=1 Tax=Alkalilimnicola ehrlichii TaxID=351052 RepID=A0A3E0X084_9GAMM|nr:3'-5' exonuclease [Alkalilimnicola ehrlichii]RFA28340.1 3'-5' exonuclease [Alkalilimnicola ehrlichii]RFA38595.1 3'-5' exonuclease [Alkalilimnicola ehrlichii]
MNVFVFDIETVPDVEGGRRLYGLDGLDDTAVADAMFARRRQESGGSDFLRHHLHRISVISIAARLGERFKVWSLGDAGSTEKEVIERFFDGIDRYTPTLVSWNGSGFDLPVLHYRALRHGVAAPRYWENGANDQSFRWNNYLSRFHERHTDLMDVLAGYQPRASVRLDEMATLCGFPGKLGMSGDKVWECIRQGQFGIVRDYCETDVLNTYLLYLRFQLMRGQLDDNGYRRESRLVRDTLEAEEKPHFAEFLAAWDPEPASVIG